MIKLLTLTLQGVFGASSVFTTEQMQIISSLIDDIVGLFTIVAISSASIVGPMLLNALKKRQDVQNHLDEWKALEIVTHYAVESAEKTIKHGDNVLKYDYAAKVLNDYASKHKIHFCTPEITRVIIECHVRNLSNASRRKSYDATTRESS